MSNLPTLFNLQEDWLALMELADSEEGQELDLTDTIAGLAGTMEKKREAIGFVMETLRANSKAIKEAEDRMAARRKAIENRRAWLERYLIENMRAHGITSIDCPEFSMSLVQNPEKVIINGELPIMDAEGNELQREKTEWVADKKAIKAAIERGEDIPGAHLKRGYRLKLT